MSSKVKVEIELSKKLYNAIMNNLNGMYNGALYRAIRNGRVNIHTDTDTSSWEYHEPDHEEKLRCFYGDFG